MNENKIITKQKTIDNRDKYPGYSGDELLCINCEITKLTILEMKTRSQCLYKSINYKNKH